MNGKRKLRIPLRLALLLIALLATTFALAGYWLRTHFLNERATHQDGYREATDGRLTKILSAWREHFGKKSPADPRSFPRPSLAALVKRGALTQADVVDQWGRPFRVSHSQPEDHAWLEFTSAGLDGRFKTDDDFSAILDIEYLPHLPNQYDILPSGNRP